MPERYARLGPDGLTRLRARYVDLATRLAGAAMEEDQRPGVLARAERLNPDAWSTHDEVSAALEEYESVFESLRPFAGRQGRPRRL